jgi:hypothetical protein
VRRLIALSLLLMASSLAGAQELEPRAYSPSPTGTRFVVVGVGESSGDVSVDPALPIDNVSSTIDSLVAGYGQTFGLFGRSASLALVVPYVDAQVKGDVAEVSRSVTRTGFGDLRLRFTLGLLGSPALSPREFVQRTPAPALGASLIVVAPTGEYFPDKLINIGANRWSFKPEIGLTWPRGKWYLELTGGVWLFGDNDDFFGGVVREQEALTSFQANASYTFRPRLWLSAGWTHYTGGRTIVDSVRKSDWQDNDRYGVTLSIPLSTRQSIKFAASRGAATRIGSSFDTYGISWQMVWF